MHPRTYAATLIGSLSSVSFYWTVLRQPLLFSVRFFLMSCLIVGVLDAVHFNVVTIPNWREAGARLLARVDREYPPDLTMTWDGQQLQWQPNQVLTVPYPPEIPLSQEGLPSVLAQFTPVDASPEELAPELPERSLFIVTPTQVFITSAAGSWNQLRLLETPGFENTFTINRESLPSYLNFWQQFLENALQGLGIASFIFIPLATLLSLLFTSVLDATLFYFLMQLTGIKWRWPKVWQLTLHIIVVALLIETIVRWFLPATVVPVFAFASWGLFTYIVVMMRFRPKGSQG